MRVEMRHDESGSDEFFMKHGKKKFYLDSHATTPVDPEVLQTMLPFFSEDFGNSVSPHVWGWKAAAAVDIAREQVAKYFSVKAERLIFNSGTTEGNNTVFKSLLFAKKPRHVITQVTEHACVLENAKFLKSLGHDVTILPVNAAGIVEPETLKKSLRIDTALVSIMAANNETGVIQPLKDLVQIVRENSQALFHSDAAQIVGHEDLPWKNFQPDFITFSAHKMYGPKGIGVLVFSEAAKKILQPLHGGGDHEFGFRAGTLNVPGIVGLAKALAVSEIRRVEDAHRLFLGRDLILKRVLQLPGVCVNGSKNQRLVRNLHVTVDGVESSALIQMCSRLGFSSGSACATSTGKPSHVLLAMGLSAKQARESFRLGLPSDFTVDDAEEVAEILVRGIQKIRGD